uniref:Uncharacterized protein n=1 Tax=Anguilla anguilla TaxID=7936 RepID=A0A0E9Q859_ANGAN
MTAAKLFFLLISTTVIVCGMVHPCLLAKSQLKKAKVYVTLHLLLCNIS